MPADNNDLVRLGRPRLDTDHIVTLLTVICERIVTDIGVSELLKFCNQPVAGIHDRSGINIPGLKRLQLGVITVE